ncbi:hypothetical protein TTHERM_00316020 (macronuclear) [Tetrahymena thermophila SB210]|uniref:DUF4460 domain-containing protein n=1 Tax=Tetrahymena thermophila (strain SB210) TaxID=312017 RepID=I7LW65_TETTS|nr:hypothetical protein TTHERM_00316020 [Tetrahymena thermophila SB210]EAS01049.2 hypothetical protein TTHERM_00316020 [Tetrahymena thermophila SB210]|eukprot:XP_001021294.2 hypothetical protein TTHERM_00316020 [Tetrahymena thermophila SB210]
MFALKFTNQILQLNRIQNSLYQKIACQFSLSSSFKSRSKLGEFYKNVHPDVLGNAPEKIKEENGRSLRQLNQYLDSLSQNQGAQQQKLVFYVPDKVNKKAKKYLQIEVRLNDLNPNVTQETLQLHMDQTIAILLNELKEVRIKTNPFLADQLKNQKDSSDAQNFVNEGEDEESVFQRYQQTMGPMKKHETFIESMEKKLYQGKLGSLIFQHINEYNYLKTIERIREEMYDMDKPSQKPLLWAKILADDTGYLINTEQLFSDLIDPRLIFIDETLNKQEIDQFMSTLIQDEVQMQTKKFQKIKEVFHHMENQSPQICLYVTRKYSGSDMPGFFSIPFNFNPDDIAKKYEEYAPSIIQARQEIDYLANKVDKLTKEIIKQFEIKDIKIPQAKNVEEYNQQILFLKKLKKLILDIYTNDRDLLTQIKLKRIVCFNDKEKYDQAASYISAYDINLQYIFSEEEFFKQV